MAGPKPPDHRGFTLLEVLVAMAIFAVISGLTFQGLREMAVSRERLAKEGERLAALQGALAIMARDFEQGADRRIRDEYGNFRPALIGGEHEPDLVELSRGGFRNPAGRPRASLQRIAYRLTDHTLIRRSWPVLDRAATTDAVSQPLLSGVTALKIEFMDSSKQWRPSWPPEGDTALRKGNVPKALRVTIELEDWGTITRLFPTGNS